MSTSQRCDDRLNSPLPGASNTRSSQQTGLPPSQESGTLSQPVEDAPSGRVSLATLLWPGSPKNPASGFHRTGLKQVGEGLVARHRTIRSRSWSVSSAGPFTATCAAASNLSVGSGAIVIFSSLTHLTASARFRARA